MRLKIGCCGFPVSQERYFKSFPAVEINSTFYNLPKLSTAQKWRETAPSSFEFTVKCWQLITHPPSSLTYRRLRMKIPEKKQSRYGHFRPTYEVQEAWESTKETAAALGSRVILFQTPESFYPQADHLGDLYSFFKRIRREDFLFVWEPRGSQWREALLQRIAQDLKITVAFDPLREGAPLGLKGEFSYFRLHGTYDRERLLYDYQYSLEEIQRLAGFCRGRSGYVFFNNRAMWEDSSSFQKLCLPGAVPSRRD